MVLRHLVAKKIPALLGPGFACALNMISVIKPLFFPEGPLPLWLSFCLP